MGIWGWAGTIAAGWFALSVLVAAGWGVLRHFTRTDADRLREDLADLTAVLDATTGRAEDELLDAIHRVYVADGIADAERYLSEVR